MSLNNSVDDMDSILKKYRSLECRSCEQHFGYQSRNVKNEIYCSVRCMEKGGVGCCSRSGNNSTTGSTFGGYSKKDVAISVSASKISKKLEDLNMGTPSPSSSIISQTAAAIPTPTPIQPKRVVAPMEPPKRIENDVIAPPVMKSAPVKPAAPLNIVASNGVNDNDAPMTTLKVDYNSFMTKRPGTRLPKYPEDESVGVRRDRSTIKRCMLVNLPLSPNLQDGSEVGVIFSWNLTRHLIGSMKDDDLREEMQGALGSREYEQYKGIPQVGEVVIGKYDAALYRAVVTKLEGDNAHLDFIDYGDSTVNKLRDLKFPDEKLINTPLYGAIVNLVVEKPVEKATPDFEKNLSKALVVEYCGEPPKKPFEYLALLWLSDSMTLNKSLESKPAEA